MTLGGGLLLTGHGSHSRACLGLVKVANPPAFRILAVPCVPSVLSKTHAPSLAQPWEKKKFLPNGLKKGPIVQGKHSSIDLKPSFRPALGSRCLVRMYPPWISGFLEAC
jgi:hypothetical protein